MFREKKFFHDIRNRLKKAVKQVAVFKEKMTEGFVNGEDKVPVSTVDEFKGHSNRPVVGIFYTTGRAKLGVAAERDKFEIATMGAAIYGTTVRRIATIDDLFDVFHNNRSWLKVSYLIIS